MVGEKKRRFTVWVLLLVFILGAFPFIPAVTDQAEAAGTKTVPVKVTADYDMAYQVLELVNKERKSYGLSQLTMDVDLLEAAMQRAAENVVSAALTGNLDHNRPDGTSCFTVSDKTYGENLACGYATAELAMKAWMNSTGHRSNILNPDYISIGVGCVSIGVGDYKVYWAQEFGYYKADTGSKPANQIRVFNSPITDVNYVKVLKLNSKWEAVFTSDTSGGGSGSGSGSDTPTVTSGWRKINGQWYYFDAAGLPVTGWQKISGKWYYMSVSGVMQTGWQKVSGKWYYLNADGSMAVGWKKISGKWYFLAGGGAMATGWRKISGKWYYLNGGGDMATGWKKVSGKWYYLSPDGSMITGWLLLDGKWYYLTPNGDMVIGTAVIDGINYTFNGNGVCLDK